MIRSRILLLHAYILFFAYLLNLFWEVAHAPLFEWSITIPLYVLDVLLTALGDAIVILIMYWIMVGINRNLRWIFDPSKRDYIVILGLGLIFGVLNEIISVHYLEKWEYNSLMPMIPLLDVGLSPVVQMLVLPLLTLWLVKNQFSSQ